MAPGPAVACSPTRPRPGARELPVCPGVEFWTWGHPGPLRVRSQSPATIREGKQEGHTAWARRGPGRGLGLGPGTARWLDGTRSHSRWAPGKWGIPCTPSGQNAQSSSEQVGCTDTGQSPGAPPARTEFRQPRSGWRPKSLPALRPGCQRDYRFRPPCRRSPACGPGQVSLHLCQPGEEAYLSKRMTVRWRQGGQEGPGCYRPAGVGSCVSASWMHP